MRRLWVLSTYTIALKLSAIRGEGTGTYLTCPRPSSPGDPHRPSQSLPFKLTSLPPFRGKARMGVRGPCISPRWNKPHHTSQLINVFRRRSTCRSGAGHVKRAVVCLARAGRGVTNLVCVGVARLIFWVVIGHYTPILTFPLKGGRDWRRRLCFGGCAKFTANRLAGLEVIVRSG